MELKGVFQEDDDDSTEHTMDDIIGFFGSGTGLKGGSKKSGLN
jgi:hypothetical protein